MKKLLFALFLLAFTATAFTVITYDPKSSTAEVDQEGGVYIFYRSKPVKEYEYLGTYKIVFALNDKPKTLFNQLVNKVKKKYPEAEGIIINSDMDKCDAIKFKP